MKRKNLGFVRLVSYGLLLRLETRNFLIVIVSYTREIVVLRHMKCQRIDHAFSRLR